MVDYSNSNKIITKINRKTPLKLMIFFLILIYIIQYPISLIFAGEAESRFQYTFIDLGVAYIFVIFSSFILFSFFHFGTKIINKRVSTIFIQKHRLLKRINKKNTILIILFFYLWTFLMLKLKIGMTIFTDFEILPFHLVGFLFYGRLFIQPVILSFLAFQYEKSTNKLVIFIFIFLLGLWVTLTSGSRFAATMFAVPLLLLFTGKKRFVIFGITLFLYIMTGTLSRHFYLPYQIGGDYIEIYANEVYQSNITKDLILLPINYVVIRIMGISEVMMTLNFQKSTNLLVSINSLISYFIPIIKNEDAVSAKNIFGYSDDTFGGFSLDIFSNYWIYFGRSLITYVLGLSFISLMFGRIYVYVSIFLQKIGFKEGELIIFILLFILFMDGRAFMFPIILFVSWFLYKIKFKS